MKPMRQLMTALLGTVALGTLGVASAAAADLPMKAPVYTKAPVMAPVTSWAGFYIGANGGYGWDPANASFNPTTYVTTIVPAPGFVDTGPDTPPFNMRVAPKGWLGGGQFGYNWQQQSLVYGLEADFDFSGMKASTSVPWFVTGKQPDNVFITGQTNLSQKLDYFGTLRGRIGWANDNLLIFGTGGFAWGHVGTTFSVSNVMEPTLALTPAQLAALQNGGNASASSMRVGFAVGAGAEWKIARNWSVKAEYLFVDLLGGGQTLIIPGGVANAGYLPVQTARLGVNYFFQP